jgi:HEAT repeat protein
MTGRRVLSWAAWLGLVCCAVSATRGTAGEFAGKPAAEWLKILREHKNPKARRLAMLALETIGPKVSGVAAGLTEALREDPDPEIRRDIAILLGRLGPDVKGAADALGDRLTKDSDPLVRQAAATALGGRLAAMADGQVVALAAALKDKHEGTRRAAAETLKNLGEAAQPAVPQLLDVVKDAKADRFTRVYAIQVVSQWGQDDSGTGPALVAALGEKDAHGAVRQAAAEGLGRLGDYAAGVEALGRALEDATPDVRRAAAVALGPLGGKAAPAWPAIRKTLEDKKSDSTARFALVHAAASLVKQHPEAVPLLAKLAQEDDAAENRLAAIQELGELGAAAEKAVPALQVIAQTEARATLRDAAAAALKKIKGK